MRGWQLLALSGGKPITLMGEWNGRKLRLLGIWHDGGYWQANAGEQMQAGLSIEQFSYIPCIELLEFRREMRSAFNTT